MDADKAFYDYAEATGYRCNWFGPVRDLLGNEDFMQSHALVWRLTCSMPLCELGEYYFATDRELYAFLLFVRKDLRALRWARHVTRAMPIYSDGRAELYLAPNPRRKRASADYFIWPVFVEDSPELRSFMERTRERVLEYFSGEYTPPKMTLERK